MIDYKIAFGVVAVVIGFISYVPYFRDFLTGKTKPHVFTWFIWFLVTAIAFFAQLVRDGGAGAWVNGATAFLCLAIAIFALFRGEKDITRLDWICFWGALAGIGVWLLTNNPLWGVIIATVVDALAFVPTFRKALIRPREETVSTYFVSSFKYALSLVALSTYSLTTVIFPAYLVLANALFAILVVVRRIQTRNLPSATYVKP